MGQLAVLPSYGQCWLHGHAPHSALQALLFVYVLLQVKLLSARGLASTNDQFSGYQAKLAVSGRNPVLTGLAASGDQQEVLWGHEEQFSEVSGLMMFGNQACVSQNGGRTPAAGC